MERLARAKSAVEEDALGRLGDEMSSRMRRMVMEREARVIDMDRLGLGLGLDRFGASVGVGVGIEVIRRLFFFYP